MKIIALIPAKNEELLIATCLNSLKAVVDEIVVYDDHSTDATIRVAQDHGAIVITENYKTESGWPEYEIRERLLKEARQRQATHIISLDADESITPNFARVARETLEKMSPGDTLSLRWITLWKNSNTERLDGVFKNLYKDFAFCDDQTSHHQYAFLGVGRTPYNSTNHRHTVPSELGGILHFQYAIWEKTQVKQAWYRCSELIKRERSPRRINHTYSNTLDGRHVITKQIPKEWQVPFEATQLEIQSLWQYHQILEYFNQYGIEYFEPLQIWHIDELRDLYIKQVGSAPQVTIFPQWLLYLNTLKNKFLHG